MKVKPFFVVFPVLVGVVIYAYYAPEEKPEGAATPKEYIERVEKKRSEKQQAMKAEEETPVPESKEKNSKNDAR
jgi:hypothetical protein